MTHKSIRLMATGLVLACLPLMAAQAADVSQRTESLNMANQAITVLDKIEQTPDHAIPQDLLANAKAVAVVPTVVKAGFVIGARHGEGLVSVRRSDGSWSYPVFIDLSGGSVGFQAGVSSTDVVLVFRTERGINGLVHGKFTLGANAALAAGPVGRNAHAATDAQLHAEIYSYSRSRGLFAGVALDGTALTIDYDAMEAVYGKGITPRRVFEGGVTDVPAQLKAFRKRLALYSGQQASTAGQ
ncbi:MAG TPA: lipid-binding SYLF domain-containing protein [Oleiagrimonas sp.]|nr:lipid-binding SYLF domain-containing protein [Oleiagrimonas sp.]